MRLRSALYARGILPSTKLPVPVISVGNLTLGGTGKTPMVIYLCRLLSPGWRPGIVSRGYGGRSPEPVNLVSDGRQVLLAAEAVGDEPVLLAQSLPGVAVVTSRRRADGGAYLAERGLANLLILDDGFQHLALQRDLNLVLFADQVAVQAMAVFPGGRLREAHAALRRADAFILTGSTPATDKQPAALRAWLHQGFPQTPIYHGGYQAVGLWSERHGQIPLDSLHDSPLFAFCGIANPQSFRQTLAGSLTIRGWQLFADHHPFNQADLTGLNQQAKALGCVGLITTEKDSVKLKALTTELPLWVLSVELRMEEGFDRFIQQRLGRQPGEAPTP